MKKTDALIEILNQLKKLKKLHLRFNKKIKPSTPFTLTVKMSGGKKVNIVFIMNRRNSKNGLALLSTDLEIDGEEVVVRIYGYRWDIEVCFRVI